MHQCPVVSLEYMSSACWTLAPGSGPRLGCDAKLVIYRGQSGCGGQALTPGCEEGFSLAPRASAVGCMSCS